MTIKSYKKATGTASAAQFQSNLNLLEQVRLELQKDSTPEALDELVKLDGRIGIEHEDWLRAEESENKRFLEVLAIAREIRLGTGLPLGDSSKLARGIVKRDLNDHVQAGLVRLDNIEQRNFGCECCGEYTSATILVQGPKGSLTVDENVDPWEEYSIS